MINTYSIDPNITDTYNEGPDLWIERIDNLLNIINKQSMGVDCNDNGTLNKLASKLKSLISETSDDICKKQLEVIFFKFIHPNFMVVQNSCECDDVELCELKNNIQNIRVVKNSIPNYIIANEVSNIEDIIHTLLPDYINSQLYNICNADYWEDVVNSDEDGIEKMKRAWGDFISISNCNIQIMDRNIYNYWWKGNNYRRGLKQFISLLEDSNFNRTLEIILGAEYLDITKSEEIQQFINDYSGVRIQFRLVENLQDHDRFIKFGNYIGAELNRGLDTFVHRNNPDPFRVKYLSVENVDSYFTNALDSEYNEDRHKPIRNFEV